MHAHAADRDDGPARGRFFDPNGQHDATMLRFNVFENGAPAKQLELTHAHLLGGERVPIRGELRFESGQIICEPRSRVAASLAVLWSVKGFGRVLLETPRLLDRKEPYNLLVELARGQMMRISLKREDWGLYDYPDGASVYRDVESARDLLLDAMTAADDTGASALAEQALAAALRAGEAVGALHADCYLCRRAAMGQTPPGAIGGRLDVAETYKSSGGPVTVHPQRIPKGLDFLSIPMSWRHIEPKEGKASLTVIEPWVRAVRDRKMNLWAGALLTFDAAHRPTWWKGSARDFERLRDTAAKHLRQMFKALTPHVAAWEVCSGLHAENPFKLNLEQIMDLTRLAANLARQTSPKIPAILTITPPWSDYYAADPQTIPATLYAEMALQSGIPFDAFGIEIRFDGAGSGPCVRDLMQVSSILDRYGNLGKPLHVVAAGVPSSPPCTNGSWHGDWSEEIQANWLREFYQIALSKPFVETVAWHGIADEPGVPACGGLLRADLTPKPAYQELIRFRDRLTRGAPDAS